MSPAKQKSKERQAAHDRKPLIRQPASCGTGASAYNPVSGTFHALESVTTDAGVGYINGRFKSIDDDDNSSLNGGGTELECMSNNGSCSGESEDQKEKSTTGKTGGQACNISSTEKRDKVRGKNERKHQRQKERRAQELRDKCTSYLMSRKLEALSQQLVAMGFTQERATMALIFNDGHIEQSVTWLLEGGESQVQEDWNAGSNPKIDISEELQRILEIEKKYKFPRPEIERAIVSCEGDLDKALECLRMRSCSSSPTRDENGKPQTASIVAVETIKEDLHTHSLHGHVGYQSKNNVILRQAYQIRRNDRTILHSKGTMQQSSVSTSTSPEVLSKDASHAGKLSNSLTTEIQNSALLLERRMNAQATRFPPTPCKVSSPYTSHFPPIPKADAGLIFGDPKLTSGGSVREPVLSTPPKDPSKSFQPIPNHFPVVASSELSPCTRIRNSADVGSQSSVLCANATHGSVSSKVVKAEKKAMESFHTGITDMHGPYNLVGPIQPEASASQQSSWISNGVSNRSPARQSRSPVAMTNGLFTGWGVGVSPSVDWSTGPVPNFDYRNIDWSMNASTTTTVHRLSSSLNSLTIQESDNHYWNNGEMKVFRTEAAVSNFRTQSSSQLGIWNVSPAVALQANTSSNSAGNTSHEWTSPFAGKELFNLPQAVPSPSL